MKKTLSIVILAAGKGTRMKSRRPKVLHPLLGRPMISHVLALALAVKADRRGVVVGHGGDEVAALLDGRYFETIRQKEQLGTGHAVGRARRLLAAGGDVVVLSGDTPLLTAATLRRLIAGHRRRRAAVTVLTTEVDEPKGYGRIIRGARGSLEAIVEEKDASPAERAVGEVNTGTYCFDAAFLLKALRRLGRDNSQGEYYLTDVVGEAVRAGKKAVAVRTADAGEVMGINSRVELAEAEAIMRQRKLLALMTAGVTVVDPASTYVEAGVRVGADTVLLPMTFLEGETRVGRGCRIGPMVRVRDSHLGPSTVIKEHCVIEEVRIGARCSVGPFAHLRPGTILAEEVKVGNFVEIKKSRLGRGTKASHLSYIGDSTIGKSVNIGAGTITCNYDGSRKWETIIGDGVFVGSGTQFIAPVTIGRRALIAAGSTITRDVPPGTLALSRTPQKNREGKAALYLKK